MCGEKYSSKYSPWKTDGSPPRVRGEAENTVFEEPEARITPACAGRSTAANTARGRPTDHPRVCGEKFTRLSNRPPKMGSPPRVRGEGAMAVQRAVRAGITPACAGRRVPELHKDGAVQDHPRVCGEKTKKIPNISRFYPGAACFSFSFS